MKIGGLNKLQGVIRGLKRKAKEHEVSVQVGFTQNYAMWVHEDMDANHTVGQAKFLEVPARSLQLELHNIITKVFKQTGSMQKALLMAGYRLQREAQQLVPVDTSALKASAYTALDSEADAVADAAHQRSEQIKKSALKARKK